MAKSGPKINEDLWAKAKALYECGKSLRQITSETGIDSSNISKRSRKEGWEKEKIPQLIADTVRVKAEFSTLNKPQQEIVTREVDKQIKMLEFFNNSTLKNCSIMMKKVNSDMDIYGHNSVQNTLHKGKETVFGKTPDVQFNNINAQNNEDKVTTIARVIVGCKVEDLKP
jgi:hypothetical protein